MKIIQHSNGQIEVKSKDLTLIQTNVKGYVNNDCYIDENICTKSVTQHDPRFKPLFIALHNFKIKND